MTHIGRFVVTSQCITYKWYLTYVLTVAVFIVAAYSVGMYAVKPHTPAYSLGRYTKRGTSISIICGTRSIESGG